MSKYQQLKESLAKLDAESSPDSIGRYLASIKTIPPRYQQQRQVIFADETIANAPSLMQRIGANACGTPVVEQVASDQDGWEVISASLGSLDGVRSIHVLCQGDGRGFQLGRVQMDNASITGYAGDVVRWADAMGQDPTILIHGANLTLSFEGRMFLESLSQLTQAEVACVVNGKLFRATRLS